MNSENAPSDCICSFLLSDYVCHKRITKAKNLLETTSLSVGDVGRQVGIYDVSYFTQCFKKQVGFSPMKFRQHRARGAAL